MRKRTCEAAAEFFFLLFYFFFSVFKNCCALAFYFFCPFAVRRPLPWLGSVAVIIPHKQGTSSLWGRVLFCPPCFFLPRALGKGGAESRERPGDSFISLYNVLLTMCVRLLACVYTHRVTNAVLVGFICWCEWVFELVCVSACVCISWWSPCETCIGQASEQKTALRVGTSVETSELRAEMSMQILYVVAYFVFFSQGVVFVNETGFSSGCNGHFAFGLETLVAVIRVLKKKTVCAAQRLGADLLSHQLYLRYFISCRELDQAHFLAFIASRSGHCLGVLIFSKPSRCSTFAHQIFGVPASFTRPRLKLGRMNASVCRASV